MTVTDADSGAKPSIAAAKIQSPPLTENFVEIPVMDHDAYDYEWLERQKEKEVTTSV